MFSQRIVFESLHVSRGIINYANGNPIADLAMRNLRSMTEEMEQLASDYDEDRRADFFLLDLATHLEIAKAAEASSHVLCAISRSFFESVIAWAGEGPTNECVDLDDEPSQLHRIAGFHVLLAEQILKGEMSTAMFLMREHLFDCFKQSSERDTKRCKYELDIFFREIGHSFEDEHSREIMRRVAKKTRALHNGEGGSDVGGLDKWRVQDA